MAASSLIVSRDQRLDYYQSRRVLVVGADGFLGVNCVHLLQALGARVSVLIRHDHPRAAGPIEEVFSGDLLDEGLVERAVAGQQLVINFAGVSSAIASNRNPEHSLQDECLPNLRLFKVCAAQRPQPLVLFSSTRLVYGPPRYLPVDEQHPLAPQSMYAVHKITLEHYLRVLAGSTGMPYTVFRLSNPYGPHQPLGPRSYGIINIFIHRAAQGQPLTLYGDGSQRRDYIYVDDAIGTMLLTATDPDCHGQIFNLGGQEPMSLAEAARRITELAGAPTIQWLPWPEDYRIVETGDYISDLSKLSRQLAVLPHTPFADGVGLTLDYYRRIVDPPRPQPVV